MDNEKKEVLKPDKSVLPAVVVVIIVATVIFLSVKANQDIDKDTYEYAPSVSDYVAPSPPKSSENTASNSLGSASFSFKTGTSLSDKEIEAVFDSRYYVKSLLTAPGSAEFPNSYDAYVSYDGSGTYTIRSYVDAETPMGGHYRHNYLCELKYTGGGSAQLVYCKLLDE